VLPLRQASVQSTRVRTAGLQPVIVQLLIAADPDGRRAPGLHSLGETIQCCLLDMIELYRRGSNP